MRWCSRHSLQTQPATYAALVPCRTSLRRTAVRAASRSLAHSLSVLASPHTWLEVSQGHGAPSGTAGHRRSRRGALAASRQVAAVAPVLSRAPWPRRSVQPAVVAVAALSPPDQRAVGGLGSAAATIRIGLVADLVQLLNCPWPGISPSESQRRTTGGETLHAAAAWRTEVTVKVSGTWSMVLMPAWFGSTLGGVPIDATVSPPR
jgi:hypothetical protein